MFFHTFGHLYTLPVPLWLYAWGVASALVLSFLVSAFLITAPADRAGGRRIALGSTPAARLVRALRWLCVLALLLSIATGLFGNRDPLRNFSMTAFWVVFLLGTTYASALFGDVYAFLNPWRTLAQAFGARFNRGRMAYPGALDAWPALAQYVALVWIELSLRGTPFTTGAMLALYTCLTFAAVYTFGAAAWFRHGDVFSVFFSRMALLAPVDLGRAALCAPGTRALEERPARIASAIFVLAMLAGTAFDGLHETQSWFALFWRDRLGFVTALVGGDPLAFHVAALPWFRAWSSLCLVAAPFVYFGAYALAMALARTLTRSERPLRELLLDFAYTLLPIVLAYHAAHYFTLLLDQAPTILSYASDPFGRGWDLFGTAEKFRVAYLMDLTRVWHIQVGLILLGHVWSVALAHRVALRVFGSRRQALLSQLPMLALMVTLTVSGLWILSQPLTQTIVR